MLKSRAQAKICRILASLLEVELLGWRASRGSHVQFASYTFTPQEVACVLILRVSDCYHAWLHDVSWSDLVILDSPCSILRRGYLPLFLERSITRPFLAFDLVHRVLPNTL